MGQRYIHTSMELIQRGTPAGITRRIRYYDLRHAFASLAFGADAEWKMLPRTTVKGLTEGLGFLLSSNELWENTSNLSSCLINLEYGLTGREKRPHGKYVSAPSSIVGMMGTPEGWTDPVT